MNIIDIQKILFDDYVKKGFCSEWNIHGRIGDIAELGLITSEVSEAMEEVRNDNEDKILKECAGILIRTLNFMSRHKANAEDYLILEHKRNLERKFLHDRRII